MALNSFLGANPYTAFQGRIAGQAPNVRQFLSSRYSDFYNEYLAKMAQQAQMGGMPTASFDEMMAGEDWLQRYYGYAPRQRGNYPQQFVKGTRFLNY